MNSGERVYECEDDNVPSSLGDPLCFSIKGLFTFFFLEVLGSNDKF